MSTENPRVAPAAGNPVGPRTQTEHKIDVTDVRLDRVFDLANSVPESFDEVFIERKGTASFLVGVT